MNKLIVAACLAASLASASASAARAEEMSLTVCARGAGGGMWHDSPAGAGQFLVTTVEDGALHTALGPLIWDTPGLKVGEGRDSRSIINISATGIFMRGVGPSQGPLKLMAVYADPLHSQRPERLVLFASADVIPGDQTGELALTIDGKSWRWPFTPDAPAPDQTRFDMPKQINGLGIVEIAASDPVMPQVAAAIADGRAFSLVLRDPAGKEAARIEGALPAAADWTLIRDKEIPAMLSVGEHMVPMCPADIPFWFGWKDIHDGKVPWLGDTRARDAGDDH